MSRQLRQLAAESQAYAEIARRNAPWSLHSMIDGDRRDALTMRIFEQARRPHEYRPAWRNDYVLLEAGTE